MIAELNVYLNTPEGQIQDLWLQKSFLGEADFHFLSAHW